MLTLSRLRCELQTEPLGLGETSPRLSWELSEGTQSAYRIQADNGWDTGRVESGQSVAVVYDGPALKSRERVVWTVTVWTESGEATANSHWEMGLLVPEDWQGEWIENGLVGGRKSFIPSPYFRQEFRLDGAIASARLYITALGLYEAHLNGQRVGDEELSPGWTDYHQRVRYATHDVTNLLTTGDNCVGAILGSGWYVGHVSWNDRQYYGDAPRLLAQLEVTLRDGSRVVVGTNERWQTGFGVVLQEDMQMGEAVDARRDPAGWDRPGFTGWHASALRAPRYTGALDAPASPPIRAVKTVVPIEKTKVSEGRYLWNLGQNLVGRIRLKATGKVGKTVTMRVAERLEDGKIYTANYRGAKSTDYFTLADGENDLTTRFTFHGFQYVELAGVDENATIEAYVLSSDLEPVGTFACDEPLLNQLWQNIEWGWRGNSLDVPTDCPQRDERLGWTGDAQVFVRTSLFLADAQTFWEKYQQDLADSQNEKGDIPPVAPNPDVLSFEGGPAWADAVVICPWTIYRCTGDTRILERHADSMARWVDSLVQSSRDHIRCYEGFEGWRGFGDWLSTNAETPNEVIGTAFYSHVARLVAKSFRAIGRDGSAYDELADTVKAAFNREFGDKLRTQTANVLALHFDLLPAEQRPLALMELVADIEERGDHLSTGFVGTPYLPHVLTEGGHLDVAYRLLLQKSWPSYLYPVTQGATTIWERWDGWTEDKGFQNIGMNSFNHYAYGAIGDWMTSVVAGIDLDPVVPGYKKSLLKPQPGGGLTQVSASLKTGYGRLASSWTIDGGVFAWSAEVPANTTASAVLPSGAIHDLGPGRHSFEENWSG
jgi:alpha-L-rhamnosidase